MRAFSDFMPRLGVSPKVLHHCVAIFEKAARDTLCRLARAVWLRPSSERTPVAKQIASKTSSGFGADRMRAQNDASVSARSSALSAMAVGAGSI
jgi:hypothetical protein